MQFHEKSVCERKVTAIARGFEGLVKIKRRRPGAVARRVQIHARQRADDEARRIPWRRLLHARTQYVDWQEFYFWVRSIIESEKCIPSPLAKALDERCPGFLREEKDYLAQHPSAAPWIPQRLSAWIHERIFTEAQTGGWMNAIMFYAFRDPRYQRASAHWSACVAQWKRSKPAKYPSLEQWRRGAARCDEEAHLLPEVREARACCKLVKPVRLKRAVERYIEWEAFSYWVRSPLETRYLPPNVERELRRRCPGFLESHTAKHLSDAEGCAQCWHRLMLWIADRYFRHARTKGWFDAILLHIRNHPRAIRTMEYWEHWDQEWRSGKTKPYPSFREWRRAADRYVEAQGG